jgi:hypothetical protein
MAEPTDKTAPKSTSVPPADSKAVREARLAAALRSNLRKRKAPAAPKADPERG